MQVNYLIVNTIHYTTHIYNEHVLGMCDTCTGMLTEGYSRKRSPSVFVKISKEPPTSQQGALQILINELSKL